MSRPVLTRNAQLAILGVFWACGDDGGSTGPSGNGGTTTPVVSSVVISVSQVTLTSLGETVTLTAQASDASGNTVWGKTFTWTSSNAEVATVSSAGLVTAVANGSVTITAATDGVNGTATVTVTAPDMAAVSTGSFHACSVTRNGTAYCWGDNTEGQLGDGSNTPSTQPVPVAGDLLFVKLTSGGRNHTCGLTNDGEAYCWGWNPFGQLGDGSTTNSNVPVRGVVTENPGGNFPDVFVTRYEATGHVQARSVPADLGSFLATVVCIANLGPSENLDGKGGVPANDVWEIRIRVTKSSTLPAGVYGSIFVQDNGKQSGDFADENFDAGGLEIVVCGEAPNFLLEEQGNITVRD